MRYLWPSGGDDGMDVLTSPGMYGVPAAIARGARWAADLGCLDGPEFVKRCDIEAARVWLSEKMRPYYDTCIFVTVPDVVGDAAATLAAFKKLRPQFLGWPLAYVAQDGAETLSIPAGARAVFIGGSTAWKMGDGARQVIAMAVDLGKHVHIGRVNYWKRYQHFRNMGGSNDFTCDGTRLRFERDKALRAWRGYMAQMPLDWHVSK